MSFETDLFESLKAIDNQKSMPDLCNPQKIVLLLPDRKPSFSEFLDTIFWQLFTPVTVAFIFMLIIMPPDTGLSEYAISDPLFFLDSGIYIEYGLDEIMGVL